MDWKDRDPLLEDAAELVVLNDNASASFLQRKMSIGYARAARIIDELQYAGVITGANGAIPRRILVRDMDKVTELLKPKRLSQDELQDKVRELEIKVYKIMEAFKMASYEPETPLANSRDKDELYQEAVKLASQNKQELTASVLQRKLNIGYARAARILDELKKDERSKSKDSTHN